MQESKLKEEHSKREIKMTALHDAIKEPGC